uniref:Uncharacterized protein n=1 Tax=Cucumis sativus TaxID=3659 RepID=A0A0A0K3D1_CUCSA
MNLSSLPNENNEFSRCFKYEVEILALQPSSSNEFEASVVQTRTRAMVVLLNAVRRPRLNPPCSSSCLAILLLVPVLPLLDTVLKQFVLFSAFPPLILSCLRLQSSCP